MLCFDGCCAAVDVDLRAAARVGKQLVVVGASVCGKLGEFEGVEPFDALSEQGLGCAEVSADRLGRITSSCLVSSKCLQAGGIYLGEDDGVVAVAAAPLNRCCLWSCRRREDKLPRNACNLRELVEVHVRSELLVLVHVGKRERIVRIGEVLRPDVAERNEGAVITLLYH